VYDLCSSAILLHKGRLLAHGEPRRVGYQYEQLLSQERGATRGRECVTTVGGTAAERALAIAVESIAVLDAAGRPVQQLAEGESYRVRVRCAGRVAMSAISVSLRIQKPGGHIVYGTTTALQGLSLAIGEDERIDVDFTWRCALAAGEYYIGGGVAQLLDGDDFVVLHVRRDAVAVTVAADGRFQGDVDLGAVASVHQRGRIGSPVA